jgi:hypothetical protein
MEAHPFRAKGENWVQVKAGGMYFTAVYEWSETEGGNGLSLLSKDRPLMEASVRLIERIRLAERCMTGTPWA